MTNRRVLSYPDPQLKLVSSPVDDFGADLQTLISDMVDTLEVQGGVGLAAPQIGVQKRVLVIKASVFDCVNPDESSWTDANHFVLVNPEIVTKHSACERWQEGCLSVPGAFGTVSRSTSCTVKYKRHDGAEAQLDLTWPLSGVLQHEFDHLEGVLYIDHLGKLEKAMVLKKIKKIETNVERAKELKKQQDILDLKGPAALKRYRQNKNENVSAKPKGMSGKRQQHS